MPAATGNLVIMARTDIRGIEDLPTPRSPRIKQLVDAGADAIFPEALTGL